MSDVLNHDFQKAEERVAAAMLKGEDLQSWLRDPSSLVPAFVVKLCGGKYELKNANGRLTCLRNGEAWPAGNEALLGDSLSLAMVQRIQEMEERMTVALVCLKEGKKTEAVQLLEKKEWES